MPKSIDKQRSCKCSTVTARTVSAGVSAAVVGRGWLSWFALRFVVAVVGRVAAAGVSAGVSAEVVVV